MSGGQGLVDKTVQNVRRGCAWTPLAKRAPFLTFTGDACGGRWRGGGFTWSLRVVFRDPLRIPAKAGQLSG